MQGNTSKSSGKQFKEDLPTSTDDIEAFKEAMKHYGAIDPED